MTAGDIHVLRKDDAWHVAVEGVERSNSTHETQAEAVEAGRAAAKKARGELLIHAEDGTIRERDSYGNDPAHRSG